MNINHLPDDCLLYIFSQIDSLDTHLTIGAVCSRWRRLLPYRFAQIRKLFVNLSFRENYKSDHLRTEDAKFLSEIDVSEVFPNLKSLKMKRCNCQLILNFLTTSNSLTELDVRAPSPLNSCVTDLSEIAAKCANLDSIRIAHGNFLSIYFDKFDLGLKLRKLNFGISNHSNENFILMEDFNRYSPKLINLEQTRVINYYGITYNGPILKNLKNFYYFHCFLTQLNLSFLSNFPNMTSMNLKFSTFDINYKEPKANPSVRTLYLCIENDLSVESIKFILSLFPNVDHLRMAGFDNWPSNNLIALIEILPNLTRLVFGHRIKPENLDESLTRSISEYNTRKNRNISLKIKDMRRIRYTIN